MKQARVSSTIQIALGLVLTIAVAAPNLAGAQVPAATPPLPAMSSPQTPPPNQPNASSRGNQQVKGYVLPPEKYARAVAYSRARYQLYFIDAAYGLVLLLLVLTWRLGPKYRDWAERASRRRFVQALIYTPLLFVTLGLLGLPTDLADQWLSLKYDQSVQGWPSWTWDWTKGQLLACALGIFLVWILYAVIRRSPRRWWFYFWLAALPIIVFILFISPAVIDPLFFKFEPLQPQHPELVAQIERVVQRGGMNIPPDRMYLMKASEKLKSLNAYVTGFGASKRVVVWDTTIANATIPETLFVFGHEMGHYVLHHIAKEMTIDALLLLLLLYLGFRAARWMLARWAAGWAIRDIDDWASLPALLFVIFLLAFLATPVFNGISRHFEHEADRYGLEVIHGLVPDSSQVAAQYFEKSGQINLADPDPSPFIVFWLFDHPSRTQRVHFVVTYDPWGEGKSPKYVK